MSVQPENPCPAGSHDFPQWIYEAAGSWKDVGPAATAANYANYANDAMTPTQPL